MTTAVLKADSQAADRILKAATRRARDLIRNGQDARMALAVAGAAAELLIGGGGRG